MDMNFDDIPHLAVIKELEKDLGVPPAFFQALLKEDDWSFVIKLHSLIEAAITHLLTVELDRAELREIMSRLELSNQKTGKIAFTKALNLLPPKECIFIQKLSELRNKMVHDVANVSVNLESYFASLSPTDRNQYYSGFKWKYTEPSTVKYKVGENKIDLYEFVIFLAVIVIKYSPKTAIWLGAIIVLRRIRDKVSKKKPEKEIGEFTIEISKLIEALIPKEILELNQNNKHWDRQLFSGIEFVTKQIKDPKRTAYARSYDN